jgi:serine/threonine protein kinase
MNVVTDTLLPFRHKQYCCGKPIEIKDDIPAEGSLDSRSKFKKHNAYVVVAQEYCNMKTLEDFVKGGKGHTQVEQRLLHNLNLFIGVVKGCEHIHAQNVIHGDLKADNVFLHKEVGGSIIPKIGDFGAAQKAQSTEFSASYVSVELDVSAGSLGRDIRRRRAFSRELFLHSCLVSATLRFIIFEKELEEHQSSLTEKDRPDGMHEKVFIILSALYNTFKGKGAAIEEQSILTVVKKAVAEATTILQDAQNSSNM